jgi:hypothetical protein
MFMPNLHRPYVCIVRIVRNVTTWGLSPLVRMIFTATAIADVPRYQTRKEIHVNRRKAIFLLSLLGGLAACQPQPVQTGAVITDTARVVATIETVDPGTREVLLTGPEGRRLVMKLGPDVRNFAELRSGQRVTVTYRQAFAAQIAPVGTSASPQMALAADRAAPGHLPGGGVAGGVQVRVTITAIDLAKNTVTFIGPRGIPRVVAVNDPNMQGLLRSLHVGSQVDLTYVEAVSVNVEPVAS